MTKIKKRILLVLITSFFLVSLNSKVMAKSENNKRVLFISSYSMNWESVPDEIEALKKKMESNYEIDYIFMATKSISEKDSIANTYQIIKTYSNLYHYDLVLAYDDAALRFVNKYQNELFQDIPIVFAGINDFNLAYKSSQNPNMCGIYEEFPIANTIRLAQKIYPKATKIVAISDNTSSGKGSLKQYYECKSKFKSLSFTDLNTSNLTSKQIKKQIDSYDSNTIVLFLLYSQDLDEHSYTLKDRISYITKDAKVAIFKADELGISYGLLGGQCVSYYSMSEQAANMALKILKNDFKPNELGLKKAKSNIVINMDTVDKYKIDHGIIDFKNATIINPKMDIFGEYGFLLIPCAIIFVLLFVLLLFLIFYGRYREQVTRESISNEKRLEHLLYHNQNTGLFNHNGFIRECENYIKSNEYNDIGLIYFDIIDYNELLEMFSIEVCHEEIIKIAHEILSNRNVLILGQENHHALVGLYNRNTIDPQLINRLCHRTYLGNDFSYRLQVGIFNTSSISEEVSVEKMITYALAAKNEISDDKELSYHFFNGKTLNSYKKRDELTSDINAAFNDNQFLIRYQPIYTKDLKSVLGFETIVVWANPRKGQIESREFIPYIERVGRLFEYDRLILNQSIKLFSSLYRECKCLDLKLCINLNKISFVNAYLDTDVYNILKENQLPFNSLLIEANTSIFSNPYYKDMILHYSNIFKKVGINIVLDNFGNSSNCQSVLKNNVSSYIKINYSHFKSDADAKHIRITINGLCDIFHQLGIQVLCFNVNDKDDLKLVKTLNVDAIQGDVICKPLRIDETREFIEMIKNY